MQVLAVAIGTLALFDTGSEDNVQPIISRMPRESLQPVLDRLGALEDQVRLLHEDQTRTPATGSTSKSVRESLDELHRAVQRLITRVDGLCRKTSDPLPELRKQHPKPNRPALDDFVSRMAADSAAARESLMLASMAEVLRRFGCPNKVYKAGQSIKWVYTPPPATAPNARPYMVRAVESETGKERSVLSNLTLSLVDGHVADVARDAIPYLLGIAR